MERCGSEIGHELNLTQRVSGSGWNGEHTQSFRTILESQSASEHAISTGILEHVVGTQSHHPQIAGNLVGPLIQVVLRVQNHGGVTGCSTG